MLRKTLKMFAVILLFSMIAVWISNNYGRVSVEWIGYRFDTSIPVALVLTWAFFFVLDRLASLMGRVLRLFKRKPAKVDELELEEV